MEERPVKQGSHFHQVRKVTRDARFPSQFPRLVKHLDVIISCRSPSPVFGGGIYNYYVPVLTNSGTGLGFVKLDGSTKQSDSQFHPRPPSAFSGSTAILSIP